MSGRGLVIVTAASTGIGEATAVHLREMGFSVLAGVRRDNDVARLRDSGLTPIQLDVTDPDQLAAVRAEVAHRPLAGLVNNAGISNLRPLEFVTIEDMRRLLEVNVIGHVAATQAFIDGLRAGIACARVASALIAHNWRLRCGEDTCARPRAGIEIASATAA